MGPLFSLVLLSIIGAVAIVGAFTLARLFFPFRSAVVIALSFVLGATCGAIAVMLVASLLFDQEALTSATQVWLYFARLSAASLIAGVVFARLAYVHFVRKRQFHAEATP